MTRPDYGPGEFECCDDSDYLSLGLATRIIRKRDAAEAAEYAATGWPVGEWRQDEDDDPGVDDDERDAA